MDQDIISTATATESFSRDIVALGDDSVIPITSREEFMRLPDDVRLRASRLLHCFAKMDRASNKIECACRLAQDFAGERGFSAANIRAKYYAYKSTNNWRVVIDKAAVGPIMYESSKRKILPHKFIAHWKDLVTENKRVSAAAWRQLKRDWKQGKEVPGFGTWQKYFTEQYPGEVIPKLFPDLWPQGWSERNLMRYLPPRVQLDAARQGTHKMRDSLPTVRGTREGMRFLEQVTFDDVRVDFQVIDTKTKSLVDLWLLMARDKATDLILGFGCHPALPREDGSCEHLKQEHMKLLAAWVLETYKLPPYPIQWKVENGTATFNRGTAAMIEQLSGGRIKVSYAKMIKGRIPGSFQDKALGNSRAKASHESGHNLLHNELGAVPGQIGASYAKRPAELAARQAEARTLLKLQDLMPPDLAVQIIHPFLPLETARQKITEVCNQINNYTRHKLEGFETVALWRNSEMEPWQTMGNLPAGHLPKLVDARKESRVERMFRLTQGVEFQSAPVEFFLRFYEDARVVPVKKNEISFDVAGVTYTFTPPSEQFAAKDGEQFLAYFHPTQLGVVHLTRLKPHGGYFATWPRKAGVRFNNEEDLELALQYCARVKARHIAEMLEYKAPTIEAENARQEHNKQIILEAGLVQIAATPAGAVGRVPSRGNPSTEGLTSLQAFEVLRDAARAKSAEKKKRDESAIKLLRERGAKAAEQLTPERESTGPYIPKITKDCTTNIKL